MSIPQYSEDWLVFSDIVNLAKKSPGSTPSYGSGHIAYYSGLFPLESFGLDSKDPDLVYVIPVAINREGALRLAALPILCGKIKGALICKPKEAQHLQYAFRAWRQKTALRKVDLFRGARRVEKLDIEDPLKALTAGNLLLLHNQMVWELKGLVVSWSTLIESSEHREGYSTFADQFEALLSVSQTDLSWLDRAQYILKEHCDPEEFYDTLKGSEISMQLEAERQLSPLTVDSAVWPALVYEARRNLEIRKTLTATVGFLNPSSLGKLAAAQEGKTASSK